MHAPLWTCIAQLSGLGRVQSISGRGLVHYHRWDMRSIFFDVGEREKMLYYKVIYQVGIQLGPTR
jgi:hypothetical protein